MTDNQQMQDQTPYPAAPVQAGSLPVAAAPRHPLRRALITILIILIAVFGAAVGGLALLRNSRSQPYKMLDYPNARVVSQTTGASQDHTVYLTADPFDQVANFYAGQLGAAADNGCKRIILDPQQADKPGGAMMRCAVDQSILDISQTADVTITAKPIANVPNSYQTQIEVNRAWGIP